MKQDKKTGEISIVKTSQLVVRTEEFTRRSILGTYAVIGGALLHCESRAPFSLILQVFLPASFGVSAYVWFERVNSLLATLFKVSNCNLSSNREVSRAHEYWISSEFQIAVSVVSTECLESYLEDLLSPQVSDDHLFIKIVWWRVLSRLIMVASGPLGVIVVLALIGFIEIGSLETIISLIFTLLLILGLITLRLLARRLSFAHLVSKEIVRRRGYGSKSEAITSRTHLHHRAGFHAVAG